MYLAKEVNPAPLALLANRGLQDLGELKVCLVSLELMVFLDRRVNEDQVDDKVFLV